MLGNKATETAVTAEGSDAYELHSGLPGHGKACGCAVTVAGQHLPDVLRSEPVGLGRREARHAAATHQDSRSGHTNAQGSPAPHLDPFIGSGRLSAASVPGRPTNDSSIRHGAPGRAS